MSEAGRSRKILLTPVLDNCSCVILLRHLPVVLRLHCISLRVTAPKLPSRVRYFEFVNGTDGEFNQRCTGSGSEAYARILEVLKLFWNYNNYIQSNGEI